MSSGGAELFRIPRSCSSNSAEIVGALEETLGRLPLKLPEEGTVGSLARLKPYEDALDALVSAWMGLEYLAGRATALGDEQAAVWVPTDVVLNRELRMG